MKTSDKIKELEERIRQLELRPGQAPHLPYPPYLPYPDHMSPVDPYPYRWPTVICSWDVNEYASYGGTA